MEEITKSNFDYLFIKKFVPDISVKELIRLRCFPKKNGYLWNICEQNLVKYFQGEKAKEAYNNIGKNNAKTFQYDNSIFGDDFAFELTENLNTAKKIDESKLIEFYVIGDEFSWCYIVTHEPHLCGPYFIINNKNCN